MTKQRGRARRGLTTTIHFRADRDGDPLDAK